MKYGENLFGRRTDPRDPRAAPLPSAANHPTASPALVPAAAPRPSTAAAPAAAPLAETSGRSDEAGSKLIVGPNIKLKGVEIEDCDTLVVEGRIEATMVSRAIQIAEHGAFNGKVDVDIAEIRGAFSGEMTARKKLVIHASGRVSGKIRYGKMLVQEGGEIGGDIAALNPQEQSSR
ncbi:MAG TPA: polymer-forming cytoskeletal protein [Usitatibacter sp.]|jgi:cytoskeletal protein CcmA (bactofilin family)|nr:polymer-forming cytoskeletal protein [Usitatibacter sp.]